MKELTKKWWFWGVIILVILIIVCILAFTLSNDTSRNYKNQAISALNKYKSGSLTRKETSEKLKNISEKIDKEPKIEDKNKSLKTLALQMKLSRISLELFNDELSDTKISNYIKEIKEI